MPGSCDVIFNGVITNRWNDGLFSPILIGFIYSFLMETLGTRSGEAPQRSVIDASARFVLRYCKHWRLLTIREASTLKLLFCVGWQRCSFSVIIIREHDGS